MKILGIIFVHNPPQWGYPVSSLTLWPLIRLATRSRWNHCALLCELGTEDVVVEAAGSGVIVTAWEHWTKRARRDLDIHLFDNPMDGCWLAPVLGTPYDIKSLVLLKLLKMLTGTWYGPTGEAARQAVMCSELCALAVGHKHFWGVSPQELFQYLKK